MEASEYVPDRRTRNEALLEPKEVTLTGAERYLVVRAIERVRPQERTEVEVKLLEKVR